MEFVTLPLEEVRALFTGEIGRYESFRFITTPLLNVPAPSAWLAASPPKPRGAQWKREQSKRRYR
jgi:hypothetical protein